MIYADHAATTMLSNQAKEAMLPWLCEEYGNPSTLYSLARNPRKAIADARAIIAEAIEAAPMKFSSHHAEQNPIIGRYWALHYVFPISGSVSLQAA